MFLSELLIVATGNGWIRMAYLLLASYGFRRHNKDAARPRCISSHYLVINRKFCGKPSNYLLGHLSHSLLSRLSALWLGHILPRLPVFSRPFPTGPWPINRVLAAALRQPDKIRRSCYFWASGHCHFSTLFGPCIRSPFPRHCVPCRWPFPSKRTPSQSRLVGFPGKA